ncbi:MULTISPECIES: hypothetical protein [Flavobacterium]|uniref:Uncharacterized protein n=1 Tax=Flavobacterium jumunjinense TaxID=998845 RepID=A0ABV5GQ10_9FLAO|nr:MULTISPECIES: hypothetical protein [Flavobacterium]
MKKKLEAELISIAHRVLKLKNRSETKQLQEETRKLYEQLTVLRFYEENIEIAKQEISMEALEEKLNATPVIETPAIETVSKTEPIIENVVPKEITPVFEEKIEETAIEETTTLQEKIKIVQPNIFEGVHADDYKEIDFVKVEDVPKEVKKASEMTFEKIEEPLFDAIKETPKEIIKEAIQPIVEEKEKPLKKETISEEEPRTMSLNDKLTRGISIGLNDRIAFEKKLFGGSSDDFNRVVSQLNTFDTFEEVTGFINDFIKPDYNNWQGSEEYENRFLEIIEKKFN